MGRARLPHDPRPGESGIVRLGITVPVAPGPHILELDRVQERIAWFAQRGSATARAPVQVEPGAGSRATREEQVSSLPRPGLFVPQRAEVEAVVTAAGGTMLHAIDDGAAGAGWLSYTYLCRKGA